MSRPLSRRELLRMAAGAAMTPGLAVIAGACGSGGGSVDVKPLRAPVGLRQRLRQLVDELEEVYPIASALAITGSVGSAAVDAFERGVSLAPVAQVRFEVFDGVSWFSQSVSSIDLGVIASTAARLRARAPAGRGGERPTRNATARDFARRGRRDVRARRGPAEWLEPASRLFSAGREPASSRIIYRGAFVEVSDLERLFVGAGHDLRQSISRLQAGVVVMSWNGVEMVAEEASHAGTGGLELAAVSGAQIADAVARALSLSAGPPQQASDIDVVLAPSVVAPLFVHGVASLLDGRVWQSGESRLSDFAGDQIGDALVSLSDDPTRPGGYASYDFDDEGWLSAPRPLLHRGVVSGPLTDRRSAAATGRSRTGHARLGARGITPRPSNLIVAPGSATRDELVGDVKRGYLVDSGLVARCDPLRWRVLVRARRAREIIDGSLTGRVMGPVTVAGDVKSLLLGVRAVGRDATTTIAPGGVATTAPHLLTRAEVG